MLIPVQRLLSLNCSILSCSEDEFRVRLHFRKLVDDPQTTTREVPFPLLRGDDPNHKISIDRVEVYGTIVGVSVSQRVGSERISSRFALVSLRTGRTAIVCIL